MRKAIATYPPVHVPSHYFILLTVSKTVVIASVASDIFCSYALLLGDLPVVCLHET